MSGSTNGTDHAEGEELNLRVYLAMSRLNADVVGKLVTLLRSDHSIDPMVRSAIADAFEGKNPSDRVTFQVADQHGGPMGDYGERRYKFSRDMAIARFIIEKRADPFNMTLDEAKLEAETAFGIGVSTCHTATLKHRAMQKWLSRNYPERPTAMRKMTEGQYNNLMESEYFNLMEQGRLADEPRFS